MRSFERVNIVLRGVTAVVLLSVIASAAPRYVAYAEVSDVLTALSGLVPAELKSGDTIRAGEWPDWAGRYDRRIRSRIAAGDQETVVNWLLFGTTFTKQPRVPLDELGGASPRRRLTDVQVANLIGDRTVDLVTALANPGQDERRIFARDLFANQGYTLAAPPDRLRLIQHLLQLVTDVTTERARLAKETEAIRRLDDTSEQFAARSKLFRDRGLSADTSFRPNFALERALATMKDKGTLRSGSIREIAVIGPGLDFADKASGYDFYPQQTLQPFALIDSLVRLGIVADGRMLHVTTLDLSPRVNAHLRTMNQRAQAGQPYRIRLPLNPDAPWQPDVLAYWKSVGDRIASPSPAVATIVNGEKVNVRTLAVRPDIAARIDADDLNVVVQRLDQPKFDLIVATNVFIYYDLLDQALAMTNVRAMLRRGGFLLSNNSMPVLPGSGMQSVGYVTVQYSSLQDDGDHVVWYRAE